MPGFVLYFVVVISGASVLALEILGTRLLGPFYGVSLFLWSALITVTLAALSIGYAFGGRWADRGPRMSHLGFCLGAAGLWTLALPWILDPLLRLLEPLGLRTAILLASVVLFAPPLTLLGMVSPYAIRLKASTVESIGRTAGDLYALSTVASVVSALVTGFYLVPLVGVRRLILLVGGTLLLGSASTFWAQRQYRVQAITTTLLAILGVGILWQLDMRSNPAIVSVEDSAYSEVRVIDWNNSRYLLLDGGAHTVVQPDTWESEHQYVHVLEVTKLFYESPGSMLLVGLGGGSVVKTFARDGWDIDAVEIDPAVIRVAQDHFGLRPEEGRVHAADGRRFLEESTETYDLIIMDAFGSSSIPFHLVTQEFFALAASRLSPGGVLAMNIETRSWDDILAASLGATLSTSFGNITALPIAEPPSTMGNMILLAAQRRLEFDENLMPHPKDYLSEAYRHWVVVQMSHGWDNRFVPETAKAQVLTDDLNPVDLWAEEINLVARRDLHDFFSEAGLSW